MNNYATRLVREFDLPKRNKATQMLRRNFITKSNLLQFTGYNVIGYHPQILSKLSAQEYDRMHDHIHTKQSKIIITSSAYIDELNDFYAEYVKRACSNHHDCDGDVGLVCIIDRVHRACVKIPCANNECKLEKLPSLAINIQTRGYDIYHTPNRRESDLTCINSIRRILFPRT